MAAFSDRFHSEKQPENDRGMPNSMPGLAGNGEQWRNCRAIENEHLARHKLVENNPKCPGMAAADNSSIGQCHYWQLMRMEQARSLGAGVDLKLI